MADTLAIQKQRDRDFQFVVPRQKANRELAALSCEIGQDVLLVRVRGRHVDQDERPALGEGVRQMADRPR